MRLLQHTFYSSLGSFCLSLLLNLLSKVNLLIALICSEADEAHLRFNCCKMYPTAVSFWQLWSQGDDYCHISIQCTCIDN